MGLFIDWVVFYQGVYAKQDMFLGEIVNDDMRLSEIGEIVADEWQKTGEIRPYVFLNEWVIMADHLHGIIIINRDTNVVETPRRGVSTDKKCG